MHQMIDVVTYMTNRAHGHSSRPIGKNLSMLTTVYNVNPNCISRDIFFSNLNIRLSENEQERYTGVLVTDCCNARNRVYFLDRSIEDINNIIDTVLKNIWSIES